MLPVESVHNIVFFGETLPGYDREAARRQLQSLLRCSAATMDEVFSGKRVGLRKGLSAIEAERYQLKLKGIGLNVEIDPPLPPDPLDMHITTVHFDSPDHHSIAMAPAEDLVLCPACGHKQPRRTLCQACGINMPGFLAAEQAKAEQARGQTSSAKSPRRLPNGGAIEFSGRQEVHLFGFDFGGRCGRSMFLQAHFIAAILSLLGIAASHHLKSLWPLLLTQIPALFLILRMWIRRCHDLGWSGWMALAQWVPIFGLYVTFKLWLWPGQDRENRWGELRPSSISPLSLVVTAALFMATIPIAGPYAKEFSRFDKQPIRSADDEGESAFKARYDAKRDKVVMYTVEGCTYCAQKRDAFERLGVRYSEYQVDTDAKAAERLSAAMRRAGLPQEATGTPIIEVNGMLLPNNPDFATMAHYLGQKKR